MCEVYQKIPGYSSFKGEVGKIAENILNRQFCTDEPNKVWVTDVTEFKIRGSNHKLYLSPIMVLFNGEILAYNLATSPTVKFATDALDCSPKGITRRTWFNDTF